MFYIYLCGVWCASVYKPWADFHRRNPLLFSNVNDVPKCDLAIQYALYSISDNDFKYISLSCSLDNVGEDVSTGSEGEDIII